MRPRSPTKKSSAGFNGTSVGAQPDRDFPPQLGFLSSVEIGGAMAKIIEFRVPKDFRPGGKWVPPYKRGQLIEFCPKKTA
jgi:hypothetical protein